MLAIRASILTPDPKTYASSQESTVGPYPSGAGCSVRNITVDSGPRTSLSQTEVRAGPCWGFTWVPVGRNTPFPKCGKQIGAPPRYGVLPSTTALSLLANRMGTPPVVQDSNWPPNADS